MTSDLHADSPLYDLPKDSFLVSAKSFIKFEYFPIPKLPKADWIFFSSPRSVISLRGHLPLKDYRLACLGLGTNKALEDQGYSADYVGKGDATKSVSLFQEAHPNGKLLVPHGNQTVGTVTRVLPKERCIPLLTYKTLANPSKVNYEPDVVVFTSPSNVRSYLSSNKWPSKAVVAIGTTTEQELKKVNPHGLIYVPTEPTHSSLKRLLINCFKGK